jgi:hypothetical protein
MLIVGTSFNLKSSFNESKYYFEEMEIRTIIRTVKTGTSRKYQCEFRHAKVKTFWQQIFW